MSHRGRIEKGTVMLTGLQDSLESAQKVRERDSDFEGHPRGLLENLPSMADPSST